MRIVSLLIALVVGSSAHAEHPIPDPPEGGINYTLQGECHDNETGEQGYCYAGYGTDGVFYITFWQDDRLMFIRRVVGDQPYEQMWTADLYASY